MPAARRAIVAVCVLVAVHGARPFTAQESATAALVARAEAFVDLLTAQDFAKAVAEFDATMKATLSEDRLRSTWSALLAQSGAFKRRLPGRVEQRAGVTAAVIPCEFERGRQDVQVAYNAAGQVVGLAIRAPVAEYVPPAYAVAGKYLERDVVIGAGGDWPLPGTLTMPVSAGPLPAVVLVHDSTAYDRDETVGPNKPFRDLALGLASQGVAVLRYDKRTRVFGAKVQALGSFTVKDEVIDDALAAVEVLRKAPEIDPGKIFIAGHGLGGMLVPRVAERDPKIAGFVLMAAPTRSPEDSLLHQIRYLASIDGTVSPQEQAQIDAAQKLIDSVRALQPGQGGTVGGAPASYWLDLRGYEPHVAVRRITRPLLLQHGERDFQVTAEDLANWKTALSTLTSATIKTYPGLNHFFVAGTAPSQPTEYATPGHVAEAVVRDIALWIRAFTKGSAS